MGNRSLESILDCLNDWNKIDKFQRLLSDYFSSDRSPEEIENLRLGKGRNTFKKLRDEVIPVLHFFSATELDGEVKFQFSSVSPDCWYRRAEDTLPRAMEITRAQAREQLYIARELNSKGASSGYVGLPDSATREHFESILREPRMVTTEEVLESTKNAILERLDRKAEKEYGDVELLIEAPIGEDRLPPDRWDRIIPTLRKQAEGTAFRHVHLIGTLAPECRYFQLK